MLNILHNKINEIVPIKGVSYDADKQIVVDYVDTPSSEQLQAVQQIKNAWPMDILKHNALQNLETEWKNSVAAGWTTPHGWKLGLDTTDVTLLTGAFILSKEAAALGIDSPVSIVDTDGVVHSLSLSEMTQLMLQYGQVRAIMSEEYATNKHSILNSVTPDDVDAVTTTTFDPNNTTSTTPNPFITTTTLEPIINSTTTTTVEPETDNDS